MTSVIEFETARLRLRQWLASDREPFAAMNADHRVMEFYPALIAREASDASIGCVAGAIDRARLEQLGGRDSRYRRVHRLRRSVDPSQAVAVFAVRGNRLAPRVDVLGQGLCDRGRTGRSRHRLRAAPLARDRFIHGIGQCPVSCSHGTHRHAQFGRGLRAPRCARRQPASHALPFSNRRRCLARDASCVIWTRWNALRYCAMQAANTLGSRRPHTASNRSTRADFREYDMRSTWVARVMPT